MDLVSSHQVPGTDCLRDVNYKV